MTPEDIALEAATLADIPALIELLGVLFSIEQDFHPDPEKQRRGLELLLARAENATIVVARHKNDGIIGMASAQLVISTASGAPSAWVEDVVIARAYRDRGLGRALLDKLRTWATAKGARRLQLLADADNTPALDFYRHLGWQSTRLFAWRSFPS